MKMAGVGEVVEIEVRKRQIKNRSRIGENVALQLALQDYRESRLTFSGNSSDLAYIHTTGGQPIDRNLAERVIADAGDKSYPASECGQIVRNNRGRTPQREHHVAREEFALRGEFRRQPVKNQIEIQFPGQRDVKAWHVRMFQKIRQPATRPGSDFWDCRGRGPLETGIQPH